MHPKPFKSKYVAHGIKYEPIALQEYEKFMFNRKTPVAFLKSGLVVSKGFPVLGATLDAKIGDFGCSVCFGLAEVVSTDKISCDTIHRMQIWETTRAARAELRKVEAS